MLGNRGNMIAIVKTQRSRGTPPFGRKLILAALETSSTIVFADFSSVFVTEVRRFR
jgi:hypothetical protein